MKEFIILCLCIYSQFGFAEQTCEVLPEILSSENASSISRNYSVHECSIDHLCLNSKRDQLWAQKRVDGDLMLKRVSELAQIDDSQGVAIIDSGFDDSGSINGLKQSPKYIVHDQFSKLPAIDYGHHGTAVAGLIGGKDGVGLAPNAPLYVYNFYSDVEDDQQAGINAINDACDRGVPIINFSYYPKAGKAEFFFQQNFIESLKKRGCILIISAGNDGWKKDLNYNKPNDAIISVLSTNTFQYKSNFSNEGEIAAPGEFVYTLNSKEEQEYKQRISMSNESCEGSVGPSGKMQSGTSFGAPIVTGLTKQVESILRAGPGYSNIPPGKRVELISSIISASSVNGIINGYRAVEFAILFNEERSKLPPKIVNKPYKFSLFGKKEINPKTLLNWQKNDFEQKLASKFKQFCEGGELICQSQDQCKFKSCYDKLRKKQAICKNISDGELDNILNELEKSGNIDALSRFYSTRYPGDPSQKSFEEMSTLFLDYKNRPPGHYKDLLLSSIFRYVAYDLSKKMPEHILMSMDKEGMKLLKNEFVSADTSENITQLFLVKIGREVYREQGREVPPYSIDEHFWQDFLSLPEEKAQYLVNKAMRKGFRFTVPKDLITLAKKDLRTKTGLELSNSLFLLSVSKNIEKKEINIILDKINSKDIDFDRGISLLSDAPFSGKRALTFFKKNYKKIKNGLMGDDLVYSHDRLLLGMPLDL